MANNMIHGTGMGLENAGGTYSHVVVWEMVVQTLFWQ
jgi:hypothetical protein